MDGGVMLELRLSFVAMSLLFGAAALAQPQGQPVVTSAEQMSFRYQGNLEPWPSTDCKHEKAASGLFEWNVYCLVEGRLHTYGVHLVLSFYQRTRRGNSAYELLYWVTDRTHTPTLGYTSTSMWFYNSEDTNRAALIEVGQGVDDDDASLWLTLQP
jgi:hypothetical protein